MTIFEGTAWEPEKVVSTGSLLLDKCFKFGGIPTGSIVHYYSPPEHEGSHKCHPKGTKVLMYDGKFKDVSEIMVGDRLMGPDSKPRTVLTTGIGSEQCYRITPIKGEPWECNESHMLSLVGSSGKYKNQVFSIRLKEWLKGNKWFKRDNMLYRSEAIKFSEKKLPIDPYLLGVWLGDGKSEDGTIRIDNPDKEIIEWLHAFGKSIGCVTTTYSPDDKCDYHTISDPESTWQTPNRLTHEFRKLNLFGNKHIPHIYKTASIDQRMQLLAGLIDSDGHVPKKNGGTYYIITQKPKGLSEDIIFLARSLGFQCNLRTYTQNYNGDPDYTYYQMSVVGNHAHKVPCKVERKKAKPRKQIKNPNRTGFSVEPTEVKTYYGFQLDGDHLYLLKDFTVTHNTTLGMCGLAQLQKEGMKVGGIDTELTPWDQQWLEGKGLRITKKLWMYSRPTSGEQSIVDMGEMVEKMGAKGILFDSIEHARPATYRESEPGDANTGIHAKLMRQFWQRCKDLSEEYNCTVFVINNSKAKIGYMPWDKGETIAGGQGSTYAPTVNVRLRRPSDSSIKDSSADRLIPIKVQVKRSKIGGSWSKFETYFLEGMGVDRPSELLLLAKDVGLFKDPGKKVAKWKGEYTGTKKWSDHREWAAQNEAAIVTELKLCPEYKNLVGL